MPLRLKSRNVPEQSRETVGGPRAVRWQLQIFANMCVMLGQPERAEEILSESPASFGVHPTYLVAVAETRAQALICRGDFEGASTILADVRTEEAPNLTMVQTVLLSHRSPSADCFGAVDRSPSLCDHGFESRARGFDASNLCRSETLSCSGTHRPRRHAVG